MNPIEMRAERRRIMLQVREMNDKARAEKRDLNGEEQDKFDKMMTDVETLGDQITRAEKLEKVEGELRETPETPMEPGRAEDKSGEVRSEFQTTEGRDLFVDALLGREFSGPYRELRALQADVAVQAGFLIPTEDFQKEIIQNVKDATVIGGIARHITMPRAEIVTYPRITDRISTWAMGSELGTPTADSSLAFGKRALKPNPAIGEILVSEPLLRKSALSVQSIVTEELAYEFSTFREEFYMTGTGANQPLGVFTASANGINTDRDVATGNTETAITADNLKYVKYSLKSQYRPKASWIFHRDGIRNIALLKDGNSRYLWQDAITENEPDRLLGMPVRSSEHAPNTFTSGLYAGILGDFSNYWIVDALTMQIRVLQELYARSNQVDFLARAEFDAAPIISEAFRRVTLA